MASSFLDMDVDIPSAEELTWLQATFILDEDTPPTPPPKDDDIFMNDISFHSALHPDSRSIRSASPATGCSPPRSSSTTPRPAMSKRTTVSAPSTPPRSEWIYRTIRTPMPRMPHSTQYAKPRSMSKCYHTRSASATVSRSQSNVSNRTCQTLSDDGHSGNASSSSTPFWSNVLHPRSRSERSVPLLKTIPSQSQIVFNPPDISESAASNSTHFNNKPRRSSSSARSSHRSMALRRLPSLSSTQESTSTSNSPSSSRSESPVPLTPVSISHSIYSNAPQSRHNYHYNRHRRHRTQPDAFSLNSFVSSCPPSKSILTRTSSSSTTHTTSKSVKFAAAPALRNSGKGYWDIASIADNCSVVNIDPLDVDDDPFANHGSREKQRKEEEFGFPSRVGRSLDLTDLRELESIPPPSSAGYRTKTKGLRRIINWKQASPTPSTLTTATPLTPPASPTPSKKTFIIPKTPTTPSKRPLISNPYNLGTPLHHSPHSATHSATSLPSTQGHWPPSPTPASSLRYGYTSDTSPSHPRRHHTKASAGSVSISYPLTALPPGSLVIPVRSAPSCESLRSAKSTAVRSVRSIGSGKSSLNTRGLKAWFNRRIGLAGHPIN